MQEKLAIQVEPGVRCFRCGYDLRRLHVSGLCPECAASIAESVRRTEEKSRWRVADYILLAILLGCTVALIWRLMTIHSYHLGHSEYKVVCFMASICYVYLCIRFRPLEGGDNKKTVYTIPLVLFLLFLWCILMDAWFFEGLLRRAGILGDGTTGTGGGFERVVNLQRIMGVD